MSDDTQGVIERLREASFGVAVRGYDRRQVDEFLARTAERLERENRAYDPDVVRRRLQEVGESTTGILTAAEETARKLQTDAAAEAERLRGSAAEMADRVRTEAREFAETTRERATEEARRLRMDAAAKAEEVVSGAEARADDLLEQSLERRRVLEATIERLQQRREELADRLRNLAGELNELADSDDLSDELEEVEAVGEAEEAEPADELAGPEQEPTQKLTRREVVDFGFDDSDSDEDDEDERRRSLLD